ncbi:MAG TPA: hypothetical protein VNO84_14625 [Burkholderiaceae bacterium]|nr:hypothetical protein [Burkholderiaceae bacterium]
MPLRLVAFLLSCVLLWSGLTTHESYDAALSGLQGSTQTLAAGNPWSDDQLGTVEDHHLDDLPSIADLVEHAVRPGVPDLCGTGLTMSRSPRMGMADRKPPLVDGLLRPPRATVLV